MAVRDDFTPGEVLTSADLNDTFGSKADSASPSFTGLFDVTGVTGGFPGPQRNLIYNGDMQAAQRSASVSSITTTNYYTADRWQSVISNLGSWTQTVEADAPTGSGFRNSLKVLCTTADSSPAASDYFFIAQTLEGRDCQRIAKGTSSAQKLTLSFWVKSNVTGTYIAYLEDSDNDRSVSAAYTISASATWEKKTITFPADTTGAFTNDSGASLIVRFWLAAGADFTGGAALNTSWGGVATNVRAVGQTNLAAATNNYWQVTGVQLEVGETASGFEFLPYGVNLARCQRYYARVAVIDSAVSATSNGSSVVVNVPLPVQMRARPTTVTVSTTDANYNTTVNAAGRWCFNQPYVNAATKTGTVTIVATGSMDTAVTLFYYGATFSVQPTGISTFDATVTASAEL